MWLDKIKWYNQIELLFKNNLDTIAYLFDSLNMSNIIDTFLKLDKV
jgi:hypothetical protein